MTNVVAFKNYFGLSEKDIKQDCIICPVNDSHLFLKDGVELRSKGLFFTVVNTSYFTVISTKNNFLLGDCILNLENTACKNIYLFGSCAGIGDLEIGTRVLVKESFNLESFSQMLIINKMKHIKKFVEKSLRGTAEAISSFHSRNDTGFSNYGSYFPDKNLFNAFSNFLIELNISSYKCATVSSLMLEELVSPFLLKNGISSVDMESSILFSAAEHIRRRAVAILYVSDIISKQTPFDNLKKSDAQKIDISRKKLAKAICDFIKT